MWVKPAATLLMGGRGGLITPHMKTKAGFKRFHSPRALCALLLCAAAALWASPAHGQLFISDYGLSSDPNAGGIGEYTLSGTTATTVSDALILDSPAPIGLAISGSSLFVLNYTIGTVDLYTISGTNATLTTTALISGLTLPFAIAVSGTTIFLSNNTELTAGAAVIMEYATDGTQLNPALITGLTDPLGIAVSGTTLFVSDIYTATVGEYTTSGETINASLIQGLVAPFGIAVSGSDLYVADTQAGGVNEYSLSGTTATDVSIPLELANVTFHNM